MSASTNDSFASQQPKRPLKRCRACINQNEAEPERNHEHNDWSGQAGMHSWNKGGPPRMCGLVENRHFFVQMVILGSARSGARERNAASRILAPVYDIAVLEKPPRSGNLANVVTTAALRVSRYENAIYHHVVNVLGDCSGCTRPAYTDVRVVDIDSKKEQHRCDRQECNGADDAKSGICDTPQAVAHLRFQSAPRAALHLPSGTMFDPFGADQGHAAPVKSPRRPNRRPAACCSPSSRRPGFSSSCR